MGIDFDALRQKAREATTPASLKRELPLPWLLEQHGVELEESGSRLVGLCPLHQDTHPSFAVYEDGQRWACAPCGISGDVLDFLKANSPEKLSFSELVSLGESWLHCYQEQGGAWVGPKLSATPTLDREEAAKIVAEAQEHSAVGALTRLADLKGWTFDPAWVAEHFKLGMLGNRILAPYYDEDGAYAYKTREVGLSSKWFAASGSRFSNLYAESNGEVGSSVVIVEGESDTWCTSYALRDRPDFCVRGLPTGVGSRIEAAEFTGRNVVLAFDGDKAGRSALRKWYNALQGVASEVSVIPLPDGFDLSRVPSVIETLDRARLVPPYSGRVRLSTVFVAGKEGEEKALCNWGFTPDRELRGEDSVAYEGTITTTGERAVLTARNLANRSAVVKWSSEHGLGWHGSDQDAQQVLMWLENEGPFLSPGKMTGVLGLHEKNFVLADRTIGPDYWKYVSEKARIPLEEFNLIRKGEGLNVLSPMLGLNSLDVVSPVIAWLAAAPIRSLLREFPVLAVTGSAGTGKTVMIEYFCKAFSGGFVGTSLSGTTPYAISAFVGGTNGIPVWFDEARAGIRQDTKDHMAQVLRAAYSGQTTHKGSVASGSLALDSYTALAPIIVSGEDSFTETSHTERMILVQMPREGKNPKALEALKSAIPSGFANDYLNWIVRNLQNDELTAVQNYEAGPSNLASRQRLGVGVLDLGWRLLGWFLNDYAPNYVLPKPDWSRIIEEADRANSTDPFKESIIWSIDYDSPTPLSWTDAEQVHIRVPDLVAEVLRRKLFILPGGAKAMENHLLSYGGVYRRVKYGNFGAAYNVISLPLSFIESGKLAQ